MRRNHNINMPRGVKSRGRSNSDEKPASRSVRTAAVRQRGVFVGADHKAERQHHDDQARAHHIDPQDDAAARHCDVEAQARAIVTAYMSACTDYLKFSYLFIPSSARSDDFFVSEDRRFHERMLEAEAAVYKLISQFVVELDCQERKS